MSKTNPRQYVRIPHSLLTTDGIKASSIATYAALASYADKEGFSYPSVPSIAKRAGLSEKIARRECDRLVKLGYLIKTPHFDGPKLQRSNRYTLTWQRDNVSINAQEEGQKRQTPGVVSASGPTGESDTRTNLNNNYNHLTTATSLVEKAWNPKGKTQRKQGVVRLVADSLENGIAADQLEAALKRLDREGRFVSSYSVHPALNPKPLFPGFAPDRQHDWSTASENL